MAKTAKKKPVSKKTKAASKKTTKSVANKTAKGKAAKKANQGGKTGGLFHKPKDNEITLEKLKNFNVFAAVSNTIFAVLSVMFVSSASISVLWTHATRDEFASTTETILGAAYTIVGNVEIKYLLATIFGLSAIFSLLLATKLRSKYEAQVKNSVSTLRWIFMGITLGLLLMLVTKLSLIQDIVTHGTIVALVITTAVLGVIVEQQNKVKKGNYFAFNLSLFTGVVAWLPFAVSLIATGLFGMGRFGWYVYVLGALVLTGFTMIAANQHRFIKNGTSAKGFLQLEGRYLSIDFMLKLATFFVFLLAFYNN